MQVYIKMFNKLKQWFKERRELKQLERQIDEKIRNEGMYYMFDEQKLRMNPYGY